MFWSGYPWWKHLFSAYPFEAYPFHLPPPRDLPEGLTCQRLSAPTPIEIEEVCSFLATHFTTGTGRARLCFTPDTLLTGEDQLWVIKNNEAVIGTIRYHHMGTLWTQPMDKSIWLVDAFCVHPTYRKTGVASYLLTTLHREANEQGRPLAMFLKEGPVLPLLSLPLYSGWYVYRRLSPPVSSASRTSSLLLTVLPLTREQAHQWVNIYMTCQPNTLLIYRPDAPDACWRAYRQGSHSILACIQDTHQQTGDRERMGWVTVWLESPQVTPAIRRQAALAISDSVSGYEWLWMSGDWAGVSPTEVTPPWKADGGFHWYTYQFTTRLSTERGFGIMS